MAGILTKSACWPFGQTAVERQFQPVQSPDNWLACANVTYRPMMSSREGLVSVVVIIALNVYSKCTGEGCQKGRGSHETILEAREGTGKGRSRARKLSRRMITHSYCFIICTVCNLLHM